MISFLKGNYDVKCRRHRLPLSYLLLHAKFFCLNLFSEIMQVVLEAVADAVSQLILFSVEAEEGKSVLANISKGATGVSKAVSILVGIGESKPS